MSRPWVPSVYIAPEDMDRDLALVEACRALVRAERQRIEDAVSESEVLGARWRITAVTREVLNLTADLSKGIPVTQPTDPKPVVADPVGGG